MSIPESCLRCELFNRECKGKLLEECKFKFIKEALENEVMSNFNEDDIDKIIGNGQQFL